MARRHGWLLISAIVGLVIDLSIAPGADEPKKNQKPEPEAAAVPSEPVFISGTPCRDGSCQPGAKACRDGDCTPRPMASACKTQPKADHPPLGTYLDRFGKWLFYRSPPTPCECKGHLPAYRPPLTAWFPCKPGACAAPHVIYAQPIRVEPRSDAPPSMPAVPQITRIDRPVGVPGSSAVMAELPAIKKPEAPARAKPSGSVVPFRRTGTYTGGIIPIESRLIEPRWEKSR